MRQQQRALKKTNRELERDRHGLERQEKQLVRLPLSLCINGHGRIIMIIM